MAPTPYTLYHHRYSICSIMVRLTLAMRGTPKDGQGVHIEESEVDIIEKREQLSEKFLCEINPKGQVCADCHDHRMCRSDNNRCQR